MKFFQILIFCFVSTVGFAQTMPTVWGNTRLYARSPNGDTTGFITVGQLPFTSSTAVSGTTGYLARFATGTTLGNSSIYETGGSVGVSSATLYGTFTVGGATYINGTAGGGTTFLQYKNNGTDFAYLGSDNAINAGAAADFNAYVFGNNSLFLSTNGVKRLTISGAGAATFSGSLTGTSGNFSSTVTVANGSSSGHAVNLSQLQGAVGGTSTYIPKFNGANSINNSQMLDNGTNIDVGTTTLSGLTAPKLRVGGTVNSTTGFVTSNNATTYSVLGKSVHAIYNNNVTGTLAIEMPVGWSSQIMNIRISGMDYEYNTGGWSLMIGALNFSGGYWANPSATFGGNAPFSDVRLAYNATTSKCVILLGTTSTVWKSPKASIDIDAYGNMSDVSGTWSSSFVTSESAYSAITTVTNVGQDIKGSMLATEVFSKSPTASTGYVKMTAGNASYTGYFEFWRPNGQRAGYIGYASNSSGVGFFPENGTAMEFQGNLSMSSANKITNLASGTTSSDAINLGQFNVAVSGTTNSIPLFTGTNAIANSALTQSIGNVTASGTLTATRFISNIANGTQPYQTTSSTLNANLNANFVQGLDSTLIGQRTQKNTWTQSNTFTGTTNLNGATTNLSAALRSDYSDGSDNLVYGNSSNDLKYTSYQSILNRTQANDTFAMTTATHVFTLSTNQVNTVDIGIYTNILDTIDIRLASGFYDDNQVISITTDKSLIAGQGDKIKVTNSSGVTQLEIVNDVTSSLTATYETNTTSFGKLSMQIQYSKKRAKWRIISFKLWDNL